MLKRKTKQVLLPFVIVLLVMLSCCVTGCGGNDAPPLMRHYLSSNEDVLSVSRVVFVEITESCGHPKQAVSMTKALTSALRDKDFHTDQINLHHPACRDLPLEQLEAFTIDQLRQMRRELRCDAVLFGKMTQFHQYPRLQTEMYLRLLNLKDGKLLWAIDGEWDTTNKKTAERIEYFFKSVMREGYGPDNYKLALISPRMFQKYIAWEISRTIPTRKEIYQQQLEMEKKRKKPYQRVKDKIFNGISIK